MWLLNKLISKIKHEPFILDEQIPMSYMVFLVWSKFWCLLYGMVLFRKIAFVHFTSKIKCKRKIRFVKNLSIDRNCFIDALSTDGIIFGKNCSIGKNTTIECTGSFRLLGKGLKVGNNVGLGTHGFFGCAGGVEIGDDTIFGNFVSVHSENHNFSSLETSIRLQGVNRKGIVIGKNCWIGAKVTILDGTHIGDGCIVAAGAVVTGSFPSNSIIGGVPAKIIKQRVQ